MVYYKSQSTVKPELIDAASSSTTIYFHKNIIQHEDDEGNLIYDYEEAKISKSEYLQMMADKNAADLAYLFMMGGYDYE